MEEKAMNKITKTIIVAAIATLAGASAPTTTGQEKDEHIRKVAVSMQARLERRDAAFQSLIDAQQKCFDQTMASVLAGQQKKAVECPVLDEMIAQTALETLVGQNMRGIEARVTTEDVSKLKRALFDAVYFGYQRGKWKNAKY
jgi:hypothetical protein